MTTIREVIEGALDPLQQKLVDKSIKLSLPHWSANVDRIFTDQHLLEQVVYNLVLNAIDASNRFGEIEISFSSSADELSLEIIDNGNGMPFTPDPSAISAPTTKRFGTGIGIPFAFKVCDALGGNLQFASNMKGGTTITITLPKL